MRIAVIGINYLSAPLTIREVFVRAFEYALEKENYPYIFLSTCNRTEIYFSGEEGVYKSFLQNLRQFIPIFFERYLYAFFEDECFIHLCKVISGLDSALVAETEIQRQVKLAYWQAQQLRPLSKDLHYLFQKGLKIAKEVRLLLPSTKEAPSLEKGLYMILEEKKLSMASLSFLFIGNSRTNNKIFSFFEKKGVKKMKVCTKSPQKKERDISYEDIHKWVDYEIVIAATYHDSYLISTKGLYLPNQILFDLSMPRVIDPELSKEESISLFNLEELNNYLANLRQSYLEKIGDIQHVLKCLVQRQIELFDKKKERILWYDYQ